MSSRIREAIYELEKAINDFDLAPSRVGREIAGDPTLLWRLRDPDKTITVATLDKIDAWLWRVRQPRLPLGDENDERN